MQKIPTLFDRDWNGDRSRVTRDVHPGCEWVVAGEGMATQKLDGTSCLVQYGILYKRFALPEGQVKPDGFIELDWEGEEGKRKLIGWVPVGDGPEDRWHREAWANAHEPPHRDVNVGILPDGTYELLGPKIQGNPEGYPAHVLVRHGSYEIADSPRDYDGLAEFFATRDMEGIVWHHLDGRMAKIKARDFGIKRGGQ